MKDQLERLTKTRVQLLQTHPFFGTLALQMPIKLGKVVTACTDGLEIVFDPKWTATLTDAELRGVYAHEVMHPALGHNIRIKGRDPIRWNIAADYAINPMLLESGFELPHGGLVNHNFKDLSADEIYGKLPHPPPEDGEGDEGDGTGALKDPGGCGAVKAPPKDDGKGDGKDSEGEAKGKSEGQEEKWKNALIQAAQAARLMGKLPACIDRLVTDVVSPVLPWQEILQRFVQTSAKNEYRMLPPNRRHVYRGIYLPSLHSDDLSDVVVAIDTSGSIDNTLLQRFISELNGVLEAYPGMTCTVIYADAKVQGVDVFRHEDLPIIPKTRGGGGTDFRPTFDYVEQQGLSPSCLIYFTDLEGSFPQVASSYPVLWVSYGHKHTVPFGEVVPMD